MKMTTSCGKMEICRVNFGTRLRELRKSFRDSKHQRKGLTLRELGERAGMSISRIADIETGRRGAGEATLKRIAEALSLDGEAARQFVLHGLGAAGTQKLPEDFTGIPPHAYEVLMQEILAMNRGVLPGPFLATRQQNECDLLWQAEDGRWFALEILAAAGASPQEAIRKLQEKIKRKAEDGSPRSKG